MATPVYKDSAVATGGARRRLVKAETMEHYVLDTMSTNPVLTGVDRDARATAAEARARGVHHVVVTDGARAVAVVATAALERSGAGESVSTCLAERHFTTVDDSDTLTVAEAIMARDENGCLPVTNWSGMLVGVITSGDLRRRRERWTTGPAPLGETPPEALGSLFFNGAASPDPKRGARERRSRSGDRVSVTPQGPRRSSTKRTARSAGRAEL